MIGAPDAWVCNARLPPIFCNPAGLMKLASWISPTCDGFGWFCICTLTVPSVPTVMLVAPRGIVIDGCSWLPLEVTTWPCALIWKLPSRV